ncbi:MAG: hypothetical protein A4E34_00153 [Methanoregula sp. PtaU1.Bin006]|nr:MAG: hypothetical protein A4E34_00153 [Methanoregula sp. PtaU1.Bin006]
MQGYPSQKAGEDNPGLLPFRPELRGPERKAPDARENHVTGNGSDCPYNAHGKASLDHVQDILHRGKAETGRCGIDDPVHRLVKLRVTVDRKEHNEEFHGLLDYRRDNCRRDDTFREYEFDETCGNHGKGAEEEDPRDQVERLGFVPVLPVDVEEEEEGRGDGEEQEIEHYRCMVARREEDFRGSAGAYRYLSLPWDEPPSPRFVRLFPFTGPGPAGACG